MNKADLIDAMAKAGEIKKTQAEKSLSALTDAIKTGLAKGERVVLPGIGSFSCVQKKARTGRNPRTGKEINIPVKGIREVFARGHRKGTAEPRKEVG